MKTIPRFYHGVADYLCGLFLLLAPSLLDFPDVGGDVNWMPRIVGLLILGQAMMTDYELGLVKVIPVAMHLMNDCVVGAILLGAPWLFRFSALRVPTLTLTVASLLVLGLAVITQPAGRARQLLA